MNDAQVQWVALPQFLFLDKGNLKYQDSLIYLSIRSFMNNDTQDCFPSYKTIGARAGVSEDFVIDSVKRLKTSGLIDVYKSKSATDKNNPNRYTFEKFYSFEQIPFPFFEDQALSYTEKAMLLCIRQFFVHGLFTTFYTIGEIAECLGISYRKVHAQIQALIKKGYVTKKTYKLSGGRVCCRGFALTNKIAWINPSTIYTPTISYPVLRVG